MKLNQKSVILAVWDFHKISVWYGYCKFCKSNIYLPKVNFPISMINTVLRQVIFCKESFKDSQTVIFKNRISKAFFEKITVGASLMIRLKAAIYFTNFFHFSNIDLFGHFSYCKNDYSYSFYFKQFTTTFQQPDANFNSLLANRGHTLFQVYFDST